MASAPLSLSIRFRAKCRQRSASRSPSFRRSGRARRVLSLRAHGLEPSRSAPISTPADLRIGLNAAAPYRYSPSCSVRVPYRDRERAAAAPTADRCARRASSCSGCDGDAWGPGDARIGRLVNAGSSWPVWLREERVSGVGERLGVRERPAAAGPRAPTRSSREYALETPRPPAVIVRHCGPSTWRCGGE